MTKKKTTAATCSAQQPPVPNGWIRCHYYLERKNRYCRQQVVKDTHYCGNHQPPSNAQRIPCPLDPTHCIDRDQVDKHVKICPYRKKLQSQQKQVYYQHNVNVGGYGSLQQETAIINHNKTKTNVEWAQRLAIQILQVHQHIFAGEQLSEADVKKISLHNIVNAIPLLDLSQQEVEGGLRESVEHYRIKSGGVRHLAQQGSLVGHLRRIGVFTSHDTTFLEMGAGRGMFGLMAAGVAAKHSNKVNLVLVERSGSRSKADGVFRVAKDETKYMALNKVHFSRIQCDLAHVHMPTVVSETTASTDTTETVGTKRKHPSDANKTVVIAKHLCGAGTDLALKSLKDITVDACVFATCCHGICSWEQYVGRDFLKSVLGDDFGRDDFDLMRRWTSGTVHVQHSDGHVGNDNQVKAETDNDDEQAHGKCTVDDKRDPTSVFAMIQNLGLTECTPQGLGRACQRLLDQGRLEYMRHVLLEDDANIEMFHYVPSSVTPQNAVLISYRK